MQFLCQNSCMVRKGEKGGGVKKFDFFTPPCIGDRKIINDILALLVRYICFANAIQPHSVRLRYDINLVSVRKHIAPTGHIAYKVHITNLVRDLYHCGMKSIPQLTSQNYFCVTLTLLTARSLSMPLR